MIRGLPVRTHTLRSTPRARRRFGQHFLVDPAAAARIAEAAVPAAGEGVLEIGPGHGALTGALVERVPRIAAVELDRALAGELRQRFPPDTLILFEGDVLRLDFAEVVRALDPTATPPLIVVGNLPYNISKPLALKLLEERRRVALAVLTFQSEVARRLTARCGQRDYGPLGILVGLAFAVRPLFDLQPGAFWPRPRVLSTLTRWTPVPGSETGELDEPALRACLRACFGRRRRTLLNNLTAALRDAQRAREVLEAAGLDGGLRPEAIPPESYVRLARLWRDAAPEPPRPAERGRRR